ncbi:metallophosphoesterase family protein [Pseudonocardia hispaniensis]|uniref:Metallophosphoesterase family protein n=1 Tax=Pseudonocardia hispaniensis TaxID=904933 RepID=A0ABW1J344_9PSEU
MVSGRRRALVLVVLALVLAAVGVQLVRGWPPAWPWTSAPDPRADPPAAGEPYPGWNTRPAVRLAVAGDVGTGGAAARATGAAMDRLEESGEFDAVLLLGDNIYPDGDVAAVQSAVFEPFGPVLDGGTDLLAVLGNHDVRTDDGEPQLAALGMPDRWYHVRIGPVELIMLDSTRVEDPEQLAWLERTLAAAAADGVRWTVVAQHHPPRSAGRHGSHQPSRRLLVPLFERFGVDLVLAGHDHDYQRSIPQDGIVYVVSGGAATLRPTGREPFTAASASVYHFVELAAFDDRLELRAVDQQGRVFDRWTTAAP